MLFVPVYRQDEWTTARVTVILQFVRPTNAAEAVATIKGALEVLSRLIDENPNVREMVGDIKDKLEAARKQISTMINLMSLHDSLHHLQLLYNSIDRELRHFPKEESAWRNLANWAMLAKSVAQRLRPIATSAYPEKTEAEWVDELVKAADTLREGAKARDQVKVDDAIWGLNHVLSTRPSVVNTDLMYAVHKMDLRGLFRELMRIEDEMRRLNVAEDDVRIFIAGGRDLGRLDRDVDDLMKQHDHWQYIDGKLRRIENNWKGHPRELDASWPKLYKALQEQLDRFSTVVRPFST